MLEAVQYFTGLICDPIKRNESDVRNIDFKIYHIIIIQFLVDLIVLLNSIHVAVFADDSLIFSENFQNIFIYCPHIWNQHEKCINMNIKKPNFGSVVLYITSNIFIIKHLYNSIMYSLKSIKIIYQYKNKVPACK